MKDTSMAKKAAKTPDLTAPQQVRILENLSPTAAHVLGISPRSLRDIVSIPRDDAGRFSIGDLIRHATRSIPRPQVADRDVERILVVVDILYSAITELESVGVCNLFEDLRGRYGDAGLIVFTERLEAAYKRLRDYDDHPFVDLPFTAADEEKAKADAVEKARQDHERNRAAALLLYTSQCDVCKRYRKGDRWVKESPGNEYIASNNGCPKCYADAK